MRFNLDKIESNFFIVLSACPPIYQSSFCQVFCLSVGKVSICYKNKVLWSIVNVNCIVFTSVKLPGLWIQQNWNTCILSLARQVSIRSFTFFYILQSKSTLPPFFCSRHFYRIELITYTINVPNYMHARGTEFNKMILYEVGVEGFFPRQLQFKKT